MVEVALTVPLFLLIFGGGIELLRLSFYAVTAQLVASEGARAASLGLCGAEACTSENLIAFIKERVIAEGRTFGLSLTPGQVCIRPQSDLDCGRGADRVGGQRELIVLRVESAASLFFGLGEVTVRGVALARNEPRDDGPTSPG